jgi:hypothetical protein
VKSKKPIYLDFIIDKLTNSIQNTISGDSFDTEVLRLTNADLKQVQKRMAGILIGKLNLKIIRKRFLS